MTKTNISKDFDYEYELLRQDYEALEIEFSEYKAWMSTKRERLIKAVRNTLKQNRDIKELNNDLNKVVSLQNDLIYQLESILSQDQINKLNAK
jgi:hypothetical protein